MKIYHAVDTQTDVNKTTTSLDIENKDVKSDWKTRFDEDIAPMITEYGGICEDPELERQIKVFIQTELTQQRNELINAFEELIGRDQVPMERLQHLDGSVSRNMLRQELREKLNEMRKE